MAYAAQQLGGTAIEFSQSVAIAAAGWGSKHVQNRGGAWASGKGLSDGVCQGLVILYIACGGNWDAFMKKFVSPAGMAMVRGVMNLNLEADRTGAFGNDVWKNFRQMLSQFVKAYGGPAYTGKYRQADNGHAATNAATFTNAAPGLYHLLIYGGFGGHSLALVNHGGSVSFFDPNYGELTLPDGTQLFNFTNWLLANHYPGITRYIIMRYNLA